MKIIYEKESEYQWIYHVVRAGCLNISSGITEEFKKYGIPFKLSIMYERSDNYVDDCPDIPH